jgi:hypothetical protein
MSLQTQHDPKNEAEVTYWNSAGGRRWVERQHSQDIILGPILQATLERAQLRQGERVVDIGCGVSVARLTVPRPAPVRVRTPGRLGESLEKAPPPRRDSLACAQCSNWDSAGTERVAFRDDLLILHIYCFICCPFQRLLQAIVAPEQFARPGGEARCPVDAE